MMIRTSRFTIIRRSYYCDSTPFPIPEEILKKNKELINQHNELLKNWNNASGKLIMYIHNSRSMRNISADMMQSLITDTPFKPYQKNHLNYNIDIMHQDTLNNLILEMKKSYNELTYFEKTYLGKYRDDLSDYLIMDRE